MIKIGFSRLSMLCALSLAWPAVHAQTAQNSEATEPAAESGSQIEEVIVTAERRSNDLQKVGLAVTAISGQEIAQDGDANVAQVLQNVPGVVLQGVTDGPSQQSVQGGGGPPNIAIRGLGTPSPNTVGAVAVYEDGVLLQGGGADFYDMSRVEVLRGPQGTLYGRGATAGAVNFITNDPTQEFAAGGRIQYGSYDTVATQGMLNVPLASDWSVRVAFNQIHHAGYFNNGQSDEDDFSARAKLLYRPGDDFSVLVGYVDYQANGTGPGQVSLVGNPYPTEWTTSLLGGGSNPIAYRKTYADLEWSLGFAQLTYIGGYQNTHSTFGTYCVCFAPGPPPTPNLSYQYVTQPYNNTWTHELRLASLGDSKLTWQVGAYYYSNRLLTSFEPGYNPPVQGAAYVPFFSVVQSFSPESLGLFGELNYALTSTTRLTGGLRETRDHVVQSQTLPFSVPDDFNENLNHLDWKARVETDLTAQNMIYEMVSTGYRPGGFVNGIAGENEKVTAYEVGSKNRIDGLVTLNGAVYYYHYSGFQNVASVPNTNPATDEATPIITILVPLPAIFYGGELEAAFQLGPDDRLTLSPAIEEARYTASIPGYATDGGTIPNTPKVTMSGRFEHSFALTGDKLLTWEVDAHYQTDALTDFDASNYPTVNPTFLQKAYAIANSSLIFAPRDGKYSVSIYGKNLTSSLVKLTVYNANPPSVYVNDPRTYGIMLSARL
jgi:iron complex outermembrane receptor protein